MMNVIATIVIYLIVYVSYIVQFGEPDTIMSFVLFGTIVWAGNQIAPAKKKDIPESHISRNIAIGFVVLSLITGCWKFYDFASNENIQGRENLFDATSLEKETEYVSSSMSPAEQEMFEVLSPDSYDEVSFKTNYPMVWGYIQKNAEYPNTYLTTYMNIWGKLQKYHGDGIPFDTLNSYEQTLVNYPKIGDFIYFANSKTSTYHSIKECYELLKSENVVARKAEKLTGFDPCSKCVGDTQHVNTVRRMNGYK